MRGTQDLDVEAALARERLRADIKTSSHTKRVLIKHHLKYGCRNYQYLAMRYGLKAEDVEKAARIWGLDGKDNSGHVGNHQVLQPARSTEGQEVSQALFGDKDR